MKRGRGRDEYGAEQDGARGWTEWLGRVVLSLVSEAHETTSLGAGGVWGVGVGRGVGRGVVLGVVRMKRNKNKEISIANNT